MAKTDLASMTVDGLLKLRDDITDMLGRKVTELKHQLSLLSGETRTKPRAKKQVKRRTKRQAVSKKPNKVAPKYRGPGGETWSGRGLRPRWLTAAIGQGQNLDEFLIAGQAQPKSRRKKETA